MTAVNREEASRTPVIGEFKSHLQKTSKIVAEARTNIPNKPIKAISREIRKTTLSQLSNETVTYFP